MDTITPARTSRNLIRRAWRAASTAALSLLCMHAAQAQAVHKCVVDGGIVYQSSPCPAAPHAGTAAGAASAPVALAASTNAAASKKKTLADMLRERDGAAPAAPARRETEGDGANILRSRMGAV